MQLVKVGTYVPLFTSRTFLSKNNNPIITMIGHRCQTTLASNDNNSPSPPGTATTRLTVIRIPRHMQRRIESVKELRRGGQAGVVNVVKTTKAGRLLIQSKNPERNQSATYTLGKFQQPLLSSKGWKHNKAYGDYFTINNTRDVAPFIVKPLEEEEMGEKEEGAAIEGPPPRGEKRREPLTFSKLHLCPRLVETLAQANLTRPTTVQLQTIPKVLRGLNVLCAAETGSGKTLGYLLPVVHRLQEQKASEEQAMDADSPRGVRALVLVPSRELAEQVGSVARGLCAPLGLVTKTVGGGRGVGHIKNVLKGKGRSDLPDVMVATPGALVKALRRHWVDLSELRFFVIDEADTMFDPSFCGMLETILLQARIASGPAETHGRGPAGTTAAQLLVVGATFPGGVGELLSKVTDLGSIVTVRSKGLHCLMPHVKQTFLKVRGADKVLELHQVLKVLQAEAGGAGGGSSALVFCNKAPTVNYVSYCLEELGVKHLRLQGEMPAAVRAGIFRSFQKGLAPDVLVCTDIASRGLDTSGVRLVVNYDFPESVTDYIHRVGRVGRAGSDVGVPGEVLSFATHPWDVELVQKIETAARRRTSLPGMESEIHQPKVKTLELEE